MTGHCELFAPVYTRVTLTCLAHRFNGDRATERHTSAVVQQLYGQGLPRLVELLQTVDPTTIVPLISMAARTLNGVICVDAVSVDGEIRGLFEKNIHSSGRAGLGTQLKDSEGDGVKWLDVPMTYKEGETERSGLRVMFSKVSGHLSSFCAARCTAVFTSFLFSRTSTLRPSPSRPACCIGTRHRPSVASPASSRSSRPPTTRMRVLPTATSRREPARLTRPASSSRPLHRLCTLRDSSWPSRDASPTHRSMLRFAIGLPGSATSLIATRKESTLHDCVLSPMSKAGTSVDRGQQTKRARLRLTAGKKAHRQRLMLQRRSQVVSRARTRSVRPLVHFQSVCSRLPSAAKRLHCAIFLPAREQRNCASSHPHHRAHPSLNTQVKANSHTARLPAHQDWRRRDGWQWCNQRPASCLQVRARRGRRGAILPLA